MIMIRILLFILLFATSALGQGRLNDPKYLVGYWPLSCNANDYSGNGNNGTWTTEAYANGPFGKDVGYFNGSTSRVTNYSTINFGSSSFAVSCWIKTADTQYGLTSKKQTTSTITDAGWSLYFSGGFLFFLVCDGTNRAYTQEAVSINNNAANHIVAVCNRSNNTLLVYINGKPGSSVSCSTVGSVNTSWYSVIGEQSSLYYAGNVWNVRYYNIALTAPEISTLYRMESTVPKLNPIEFPIDTLPDRNDPTLVGAWLNYATPASANDYSVNARNGTATSVNWERVGGRFNGASSYVAVANNLGNPTNWTVTATIKPNTVSSGYIYDGNDSDCGFRLSSGNAQVNLNDTITIRNLSIGSIEINKFYNLTMTYNGSVLIGYLNGISTLSTNITGLRHPGLNGNIRIGSRTSGVTFYNGVIRDVRVYSEAKSASWVAQEYQRSVPDDSIQLYLWNGKDYSKNRRAITNYKVSTGNGPMKFNGSDSYLSTADFLGTNDFTSILWVRLSTTGEGGTGYLFSNGRSILRIAGPNKLGFTSDATSYAVSSDNSMNPIPSWKCVSITRLGGIVNIYINGVLSGSGNQSSGTLNAATTALFIGNLSTQLYTTDGLIGPIIFRSRVMNAYEIKAEYEGMKCYF